MKPLAESCLQNRAPIRAVLREVLADRRRLLEIGSGTGQHAVYFAPEFPQLVWQTSDLAENHPAIHAWLEDAGAANILPPLALDVRATPWPVAAVDAVFSANTAHIMDWPAVEALFAGVERVLEPGGIFALYGPFRKGVELVSDGDRAFDASLRAQDPTIGYKDIEWVEARLAAGELVARGRHAMPANNLMLVMMRPSAVADRS